MGCIEGITMLKVASQKLLPASVRYAGELARCGNEVERAGLEPVAQRNMLRRVELAWPVTDPSLRQRIIDECLDTYLADNRDAWLLQPDGRYVPADRMAASARGRGRAPELVSAQAVLMARYGSKG